MKQTPIFSTTFSRLLRAQDVVPKKIEITAENILKDAQKSKFTETETKEKPNIIARYMPKLRESLMGGKSQVPTNLSYVNPRGIEGMDSLDIPLKEVASTIVPTTIKHSKDLEKWRTGCDSDWSEGYSKCELFRTQQNTAIFRGHLDTKVVKDGRTKRAGWCGMRTYDKQAFNFKKRFEEWQHFSHVIVKLRGDGRSYKIMLHTPEFADVTWHDSFSYPLHTHGGPYWQYAKIPFSKFFFTVNGRVQDRQFPVYKERICSIGIVLMDRIDGDFNLEIGFIGVTHDSSHLEKFAYELYQLPILTTMGY